MRDERKGCLMTRLVCLELWKLRKPVGVTVVLMTVLSSILCCTLFQGYTLCYVLDKWEIGTEFLGLLFPLLVTVPICWQLFYERRDRFLVFTLPRVSPRRYLWAKWIAAAISAFLVLFVPYALSGLCALYLAPYAELHPEWVKPYVHTLQTLYTEYPLVYLLGLSFWRGLLGVMTMTFGFVLGLFSSNLFVVLTVPFVYVTLDNFLWATLWKSRMFIAAYLFNMNSSSGLPPLENFWGPAQMALVILAVAFFFARVKKRPVIPL